MRKRFKTNQKPSGENKKESAAQGDVVVDMPPKKLLLLLVIFRFMNACIVRTWFVPDEYWQGPEVAHNMVFGYGYFTWEWKQGLRGYTLPLLYAAAYKVLHVLGIDIAEAVIFIPNVLQSVLAALGDFYLYKLANKLFGRKAAKWALLCNLFSWFTFYCITRTLSNSSETVLTTIALYYWPFEYRTSNANGSKSNMRVSLTIAALACIVRPTSAIIWLPLSGLHFIRTDKRFKFIVMEVIPVGVLAILWSVIVDTIFYGKLTLVQYNFVLFNVVKDLGTFYGSHPWHWYFTQGFPVVLFTHLPLFVAGVFKSSHRLLVVLILWVLIIYSFLGHKEFRFIFPVIPLCMCHCGYFLSHLTELAYKKPSKGQASTKGHTFATAAFVYLCITNIPLALYTSMVHQRGVIDAMGYLRHEAAASKQPVSVLFLMPCHSTPFYSHIHQNISMRFLECPPDDNPEYVDEAARFYQQPIKWLDREFAMATNDKVSPKVLLPTHVVMFSALKEKINPFLAGFKYKKCSEFFHTHVPEGRIGTSVQVFCKVTF